MKAHRWGGGVLTWGEIKSPYSPNSTLLVGIYRGLFFSVTA